MIRLGLIGVGRWGQAYVRTIRELPDVMIVRAASRNPETSGLLPEATISGDWREVAEANDLDAIVVASPPASHAQITSAAVRSGLPVLVEKPLTIDLREARELRDLVVRERGLVVVAHTQLFNPGYQALRAEVQAVGGIKRIRSVAGADGPYRNDVPVLWDWGPHDVSMCLDLLRQSPRNCSSTRQVKAIGDRQGELVHVILTFPGGMIAELEMSNAFAIRRRDFEVECSGSMFAFSDVPEPGLRRRDQDGAVQSIPVEAGRPLTRLLQAFIQDVRRVDRSRESLDLGLAVVDVLTRCEATL